MAMRMGEVGRFGNAIVFFALECSNRTVKGGILEQIRSRELDFWLKNL